MNIIVVGHYDYIISDLGWVADVSPFTPDYAKMKFCIVDAAVQYDWSYNEESYILVIRNTLYVPSMRNNLIPTFIFLQSGIKLNGIPKI